MPFCRIPSASLAKRSAASTVMASLVMPGLSELGSVKTRRRMSRSADSASPARSNVYLLERAREIRVDLDGPYRRRPSRADFPGLAVQLQLRIGLIEVLCLPLYSQPK